MSRPRGRIWSSASQYADVSSSAIQTSFRNAPKVQQTITNMRMKSAASSAVADDAGPAAARARIVTVAMMIAAQRIVAIMLHAR